MASVLIGNSCQTQTLQGLGRMGVFIETIPAIEILWGE